MGSILGSLSLGYLAITGTLTAVSAMGRGLAHAARHAIEGDQDQCPGRGRPRRCRVRPGRPRRVAAPLLHCPAPVRPIGRTGAGCPLLTVSVTHRESDDPDTADRMRMTPAP